MKNCPICNSNNTKIILNLDGGGFDGTLIYNPIVIILCKDCSHVYNHLSDKDIVNLKEYYKEEYTKGVINSPCKTSDIPGSINADSLLRYSELHQMFEKDVTKDSKILDVGCATGGFLTYMSKYSNNLYGIEPTDNFVNVAKNVPNANITKATAEDLPFDNNSFDIVTIDQVLEHLVNPHTFFSEAKRIIKDNGILCVSVPDVEQYDKYNIFDFYFFLIKEHIHHFSTHTLRLIASKYGFELVDTKQTYPNLNKNFTLPNLTIKFVKSNIKEISTSNYSLNVEKYIEDSYNKLIERREYINNIVQQYDSINVYGLGREFFYLLNNTNLSKIKMNLLDDTASKQSMSVNGKGVSLSDGVKYDLPTMITAFAHIETLKKILINKGYKGTFV